jgi:hypothetical protein
VSAQPENLPAGGRVPDAHRLVFAARSQAPALRAERDALDVSGMQVERVEDFAVLEFDSFAVLSKLAEASSSPSGLNASALTGWPPCASTVRSSIPVPGSQSFRSCRKVPVARRPSRLNATGIGWFLSPGKL